MYYANLLTEGAVLHKSGDRVAQRPLSGDWYYAFKLLKNCRQHVNRNTWLSESISEIITKSNMSELDTTICELDMCLWYTDAPGGSQNMAKISKSYI